MSAPQWTPGPWSHGAPAWFRGRSNPEDGKRPITAGDSPVIGNVYGAANARLIAAAPDFAAAAASLIEAWDARTTGAQQIITGKSDADLQKQAMAAIDGLRAALTKAGAPQ